MKIYVNEITLSMKKSDMEQVVITSSKDCEKFIRQFYFDDLEIYESFFILLLNRSNKTIGYAKISQGGCAGTVVDKKIIAKYCIDTLANGVILCHNHPGGSKKPSEQDIKITEGVKDTLSLFDCVVFDHIILTSDSYYSFADEGLM